MTTAYRCEACDAEPRWTLTRIGDAATTWACAVDLDAILDALQRDHEVTDIRVRSTPKAQEWAGIADTLRGIDYREEWKP